MNPAAQLALRAGFMERMKMLGQRFRLLRTGEEWDGILLSVNPIDAPFDLGSDIRELCTLEFDRFRTPKLQYGDVIEHTRPFWKFVNEEDDIEGKLPKLKVIRREDNPANFAIKYWLVNITSGDQDFE